MDWKGDGYGLEDGFVNNNDHDMMDEDGRKGTDNPDLERQNHSIGGQSVLFLDRHFSRFPIHGRCCSMNWIVNRIRFHAFTHPCFFLFTMNSSGCIERCQPWTRWRKAGSEQQCSPGETGHSESGRYRHPPCGYSTTVSNVFCLGTA